MRLARLSTMLSAKLLLTILECCNKEAVPSSTNSWAKKKVGGTGLNVLPACGHALWELDQARILLASTHAELELLRNNKAPARYEFQAPPLASRATFLVRIFRVTDLI